MTMRQVPGLDGPAAQGAGMRCEEDGSRMTIREMLFFSGSVLGPALIAQAMLELLQEVPRLNPALVAAPGDEVERLLHQARPNGIDL